MTEFDGLEQERKTVEADRDDSGNFSVEGRTRDWLLQQGSRHVGRSCGDGRTQVERGRSCGTQGLRHGEDYSRKKHRQQSSNFKSKKCSCAKCLYLSK